jgi:hypothetical protein
MLQEKNAGCTAKYIVIFCLNKNLCNISGTLQDISTIAGSLTTPEI